MLTRIKSGLIEGMVWVLVAPLTLAYMVLIALCMAYCAAHDIVTAATKKNTKPTRNDH